MHIFIRLMIAIWYAKHPPVAYVFKGLDSPFQVRCQRPALTFIKQYWQDKWIVEFNHCGAKWWYHSIASLFRTECACVSLIFTSFIDVPSLVCVDPRYLKWSTSSSVFPFIHMLISGIVLRLLTTILLLQQLVSIPCPAAVLWSRKAIVQRYTLTTVGCQRLVHLLLHHLRSSQCW